MIPFLGPAVPLEKQRLKKKEREVFRVVDIGEEMLAELEVSAYSVIAQ